MNDAHDILYLLARQPLAPCSCCKWTHAMQSDACYAINCRLPYNSSWCDKLRLTASCFPKLSTWMMEQCVKSNTVSHTRYGYRTGAGAAATNSLRAIPHTTSSTLNSEQPRTRPRTGHPLYLSLPPPHRNWVLRFHVQLVFPQGAAPQKELVFDIQKLVRRPNLLHRGLQHTPIHQPPLHTFQPQQLRPHRILRPRKLQRPLVNRPKHLHSPAPMISNPMPRASLHIPQRVSVPLRIPPLLKRFERVHGGGAPHSPVDVVPRLTRSKGVGFEILVMEIVVVHRVYGGEQMVHLVVPPPTRDVQPAEKCHGVTEAWCRGGGVYLENVRSGQTHAVTKMWLHTRGHTDVAAHTWSCRGSCKHAVVSSPGSWLLTMDANCGYQFWYQLQHHPQWCRALCVWQKCSLYLTFSLYFTATLSLLLYVMANQLDQLA